MDGLSEQWKPYAMKVAIQGVKKETPVEYLSIGYQENHSSVL